MKAAFFVYEMIYRNENVSIWINQNYGIGKYDFHKFLSAAGGTILVHTRYKISLSSCLQLTYSLITYSN